MLKCHGGKRMEKDNNVNAPGDLFKEIRQKIEIMIGVDILTDFLYGRCSSWNAKETKGNLWKLDNNHFMNKLTWPRMWMQFWL